MKRVTIPGPSNGVTFFAVAKWALNDKRYGTGLKAGQSRVRTREALKKAGEQAYDTLDLDPDDWRLLRDAMCEPTQVYEPVDACEAAIPHMLAVRDAQDVEE